MKEVLILWWEAALRTWLRLVALHSSIPVDPCASGHLYLWLSLMCDVIDRNWPLTPMRRTLRTSCALVSMNTS